MKLYDKLIALRKEKGWSQEDFAEKLNVSRQAISRWENGTALPDAQNILQISRLFGVTADYLLNDDFDGETNAPAAEAVAEGSAKRPYWYLISVICIVALSAFAIISIARGGKEEHAHPELTRVIENQVAPTCTEQGSYDEVLYCAECGGEVLRTHILEGMPVHQFENEKCIVCGEDQRERG